MFENKTFFLKFTGTCDIDFLDLLEKEEADFAEQITRQKSFLQGVFKDKEELAQVGQNQINFWSFIKLNKKC